MGNMKRRVRVDKTKNYTCMSNYHLRDKTLSLKAKGLMSFMLNLPEEWDFSIKGLETLLPDGRDGIRATLKELEEHGYLIRERQRDEKGSLRNMEYILIETPQNLENSSFSPKTDFPTLGNPTSENPPQLNIKEINYLNNKDILCASSKNKEVATNVVAYYNSKMGTNRRPSCKAITRLINARLSEGFCEQDFLTVIDKKYAEWFGDEKMEKYLVPETLFAAKHFENYLNQKPATNRKKVDIDYAQRHTFTEFEV